MYQVNPLTPAAQRRQHYKKAANYKHKGPDKGSEDAEYRPDYFKKGKKVVRKNYAAYYDQKHPKKYQGSILYICICVRVYYVPIFITYSCSTGIFLHGHD